MSLQVTRTLGDVNQLLRNIRINAGFLGNNLDLDFFFRIVEIHGAETLLGRLFQILHQALITRVIGNNQLKVRMCFDELTLLVQGQGTTVVSQGVDNNSRILAGFDHLIQVADCADACSSRQRAVLPLGTILIQQESTHQIRGCHIFVTGDSDQRAAQLIRHIFNKT